MTQKRLRVTVAGKSYEVLVDLLDGAVVESPSAGRAVSQEAAPVSSGSSATTPGESRPVAEKESAMRSQPVASQQPGTITAPMAGVVIALQCDVGDQVDIDSALLSVEAMKMENIIYAGARGKVVELLVAAGDSVHEGQPLVRLG